MAQENIDVTVELRDKLSAKAERAEKRLEKLREEVARVDEQLQAQDAAAAGAAASTEDLGDATKETTKETKKHREETDQQTRSLSVLERVLGKVGSKFKETGKKARALDVIMKAMKIPAIVTAVTLLGQAVGALGAAGFAAVAGLAPLVGVLAAVPSLVTAMVQAGAAVKMGFGGIGEALKVLSDPAAGVGAVSEALEKLSPAAQAFAYQLAGVVRRTRGWKSEIQATMLPGFAAGLQSVGRQFPVIRRGLAETGGVIGDTVADLGAMVGSWRDLDEIMARNNRMLTFGLQPVLLSVVSMLHDFLGAGGPLAERFAGWLGTASTNLAAMVNEGAKSGRLEAFLNRAGDLAAGVGQFLGDISVGLFNVGKQSGVMSDMLGSAFGGMAADFRAWSESAGGQRSIRAFFEDALPAVREFGGLIGDVAKMFGGLIRQEGLADLIRQIRTDMIPAIEDLLGGVTGALGPAVVDLATAWVQFQSAFSFAPFEQVATALGATLKFVTDLIHSVPGLDTLVASLLALSLVWKLLAISGKMTGLTMLITSMVSKTGGVRVFTQALMGNTAALAANSTAQTRAALAGGALRTELGKVRMISQMVGAQHGRMAGLTAGARQGFSALRGAAGGLGAALGGPVMVAIAAVTIGIMKLTERSRKQKALTEELTTSLNQQTGAITENTAATIAKQLEDDGVLKKARELGISLDDVTAAAMGNTDAFERVVGQLETYNGDARDAAEGNNFFGLSLSGTERDAIKVARAIQTGNEALTDAKASTLRLADATPKLGKEQDATANSTHRQAGATRQLTRDLLQLHSATLKNMTGDIGFQQSLADLNKEMREGRRTLDITTQAGRDNRMAMIDLANAAGEVGGSARNQQRAMEQARAKIVEWAEKAGYSADRAERFADKMISVNTQIDLLNRSGIKIDTKAIDYAKERLSELDSGLDVLTERTRYIKLEYQLKNARRHGGPVDAGVSYTVGEAGPELYQSAVTGAIEVIGRAGQEQRTFAEPGVVLPNEYYERVAAAEPQRPTVSAPAESSAGRRAGGDTAVMEAPAPNLTLQFLGDGSALTPADVERAALAAYRRYERERRERS